MHGDALHLFIGQGKPCGLDTATTMVERWRSLEASSWQGCSRPRISSDANRVGRGSERSGDVRGMLIDDESGAYWLRRAVDAGEDDGASFLLLHVF